MRARPRTRLSAPRRGTRAVALGVLLLCAGLAGACSRSVPGAELPVERLVVGNARITAEIAATREERARGLMFRETLPEDHGMLFLYPDERVLTFWMKDTPLALSIAFADAGGRIVRIADLEPRSRRAVRSGRPARYALEMSRGWFRRHGVMVGDEIRGIPPVEAE